MLYRFGLTNSLHLILLLISISGAAQEILPPDTTIQLDEVIIKGYQYDRRLIDVPVAVGYAGPEEFSRFMPTSVLPVVNNIPGVRMEERSPGSYRLSVRGSTLRSPFGVRNVKVYWNGLPFTDPGGNTYINLFDFSSINSLEIIKGPGGSLYGAGTGGVILLNSAAYGSDQSGLSVTGGSFGTLRYDVQYAQENADTDISVRYAHQESDGYREQTAMGRDILQSTIGFRSGRRKMTVSLLYSDLFYETPGGLTLTQFEEDPSQARPAGGPNPGAVEQKATVYNQTFYGGFTHEYRWSPRWSNTTGVYGSSSVFENPSIRNVEKRVETSVGGRTNTRFNFENGALDFGAEFQKGFSPVQVFDNNGGISGAIQSSDEINSTAALVFSQAEFFLPRDFFLTVGASLNFTGVEFRRLTDSPPFTQQKNFDPVVNPRIALLKKISPAFTAFAGFSTGFSPPTVAELYPSTAVFNSDLNPEKGNNVELGVKGKTIGGKLNVELTGYIFELEETIVIRRDESGAEYFVNAGNTSQKGLEVALRYRSPSTMSSPLRINPWLSYTFNHYRFGDYIQDTNDFSNNDLTGIAPHILVTGVDLYVKQFYFHAIYTYTSSIPLDDANLSYADPYSLVAIKAGVNTMVSKKIPVEFYAGVDNLLDEVYSLGNDLNAFGGRFYNAAYPRNYFLGLRIRMVQDPD